MLRIMLDLLCLCPLRVLLASLSLRPIHFSARSRRRMTWARFVSHLD